MGSACPFSWVTFLFLPGPGFPLPHPLPASRAGPVSGTISEQPPSASLPSRTPPDRPAGRWGGALAPELWPTGTLVCVPYCQATVSPCMSFPLHLRIASCFLQGPLGFGFLRLSQGTGACPSACRTDLQTEKAPVSPPARCPGGRMGSVCLCKAPCLPSRQLGAAAGWTTSIFLSLSLPFHPVLGMNSQALTEDSSPRERIRNPTC